MTNGDQKNALLSAPCSSTSTAASTTAPQPAIIAGGVVHVQQIPEATMAAAAIHNNERLFPQMLERLKDPSTYIDEARKLRLWMSNQRAYYPQARSWVSLV